MSDPPRVSVRIHPHAAVRMTERGTTESEVILTVRYGAPFAARLGRQGFRLDFQFDAIWRDKRYATKRIEVIAVRETDTWVVITVLVKYF